MAEPTTFMAGESLEWDRTEGDYSTVDGWSLKYYAWNTTKNFTIAATGVGTLHSVAVTAATTGAYTAGTYSWKLFAEKGTPTVTDRVQLDSGQWVVSTNVSGLAGTGVDDRSTVKKTLDALEATILGKASTDQLQMSVQDGAGSMQVQRMDWEQLTAARNRYVVLYAQELQQARIDRGESSGRKIVVKFTNPT
jgi:hypothetical protein